MALNIDDSDDENDDDDDEEEDDDEDNDDNNINSDEDDLEEEEDDETDEVSTLLNTDYHICVNVHVAQRIWFYIKIYILNINKYYKQNIITRASDRVRKKNNKLCGNFQEHYAEESIDYAENMLNYAENFRLALLAKNHIFSCSQNRAAPKAETLLTG